MWANFFRDGGFGMYPVTVFGVIFVACGFLYMLRPERRFAPVVGMAGILTFGAGLLGTSMGFITTFRYLQQVPPADQVKIAALGAAESLNNVLLALMLVVATSLLCLIGVARAAMKSKEA